MSQRGKQLEQIRDLPDEELPRALARAQEELFRLRLGVSTNQVENPLSVREKRREVARIMTVMRARAIGTETQASGSAAAADQRSQGEG